MQEDIHLPCTSPCR